jgi:hypothetical protein
MDTELVKNIRLLDGVYLVDSQEVGIYKKPTLYVWVYLDMKNKVVSDINQLFPDVFYVFNPSDKQRNLSLDNKLILKINETSAHMPIPKQVENKRCSIM